MSLCSCTLKLGFSNFENTLICDKDNDPLIERFRNQLLSFQNPYEKEAQRMSVMEVIGNEAHAEKGAFKMFPPVTLPKKDLVHGFPKSTAEELSLKDGMATGQEKKPKKNVNEPIENTPEFGKFWLQSYHEHYAETTVIQALSSVFMDWKTRGFMVSSYQSVTYLQPLVKLARDQRESEANIANCKSELIELTILEEKICHSLGIRINCIQHKDDLSMDDFAMKLYEDTGTKARVITEIIKSAKHKYKNSISDQKKFIAYKFYLENVQAINALETDLIIVLEKEKLVIIVETKSKEDLKVKEASKQLMIRKKVFIQCHKDILDSRWRVVSVIALPFVEDKNVKIETTENTAEKICKFCKDFIMYWDVLIPMLMMM